MGSRTCFIWIVLGCAVLGTTLSEDVARVKRDDAYKVLITTIEEEPYVMLKTPRGTGNDNFKGLIPDMIEYISNKLSLHYEFRLVKDGKYGSFNNNKWNGMIGEIISGEADMAAAPMTISDKRSEDVDFTEPFEEFGIVTLALIPDGGPEPAETTIEELSKRSDISIGLVKDGSTQNFFKTSQNEVYKKIWNMINRSPSNMVNSVEDGVTKVRQSNGNYIFILESATAEYWSNKEPCNLKVITDKINTNYFAFALKKGNDYKEKFDEVILDMKKNGEMNKLRNEWKKGSCGRNIYTDDISAAPSGVHASGLIRQVAVIVVMTMFLL